MKNIKFIDLFAGIGGIRLAFEKAALALEFKPHCLLSSEINLDSRWVYQANFKDNIIVFVALLPVKRIVYKGFPIIFVYIIMMIRLIINWEILLVLM